MRGSAESRWGILEIEKKKKEDPAKFSSIPRTSESECRCLFCGIDLGCGWKSSQEEGREKFGRPFFFNLRLRPNTKFKTSRPTLPKQWHPSVTVVVRTWRGRGRAYSD